VAATGLSTVSDGAWGSLARVGRVNIVSINTNKHNVDIVLICGDFPAFLRGKRTIFDLTAATETPSCACCLNTGS